MFREAGWFLLMLLVVVFDLVVIAVAGVVHLFTEGAAALGRDE